MLAGLIRGQRSTPFRPRSGCACRARRGAVGCSTMTPIRGSRARLAQWSAGIRVCGSARFCRDCSPPRPSLYRNITRITDRTTPPWSTPTEGLHRQDLDRAGGDVPADNASGVDVGGPRDVRQPEPGRDVGHIADPEPPRRGAVERRFTKSLGSTVILSERVVNIRFDLRTSQTPASRMSRPVWSRPIPHPCRRMRACIFRRPKTP